jgi:flagellar protein FliL
MAIENKFEKGEDPASEEFESEDGDEEGNKGGGLDARKIVLFIVVPAFILIGASAGLYFTGMLDGFLGGGEGTEEQHADAKDDSRGSKKGKSGGHGSDKRSVNVSSYFLEIPNMIVNLSSPDGQQRYLRLTVQLELESQSDLEAVEAVMPRVVDQFQTYLRELRVKDLRGSQGLYRLQIELLSRVNAASYPVEVKDVLFQEILIQ